MSSYEKYTDYLQFPSGRSVRNGRSDAKRLQRKTGDSHVSCLNHVAKENGLSSGWDRGIDLLLSESIKRVRMQPDQMSMDELLAVARRNPKITQYGVGMWGVFEQLHPWISFADQLQEQRDSVYMLLPHCNYAMLCINQLFPQQGINDDVMLSSYELKHLVENTLKKLDAYKYIPHGAFILAALFKGFLPQRCAPASLSVYFNISSDSPILKWKGDLDDRVARDMKHQIESLGMTAYF